MLKGLKHPKRCEIIGLCLILAASAWQVFLQSPLETWASKSDFHYRQNDDLLMQMIADIHSHQKQERLEREAKRSNRVIKCFNESSDDEVALINADSRKTVTSDWTYAEEKPNERVEMQAQWSSWFGGTFFIIGSFFIIAGKYVELRQELRQEIPMEAG